MSAVHVALCFRVIIQLIIFIGIEGAFVTKPSNTAALSGSSPTLTCIVNSSRNDIMWYLPVAGQPIVRNCVVQSGYTGYDVVMTAANECSLKVVNVDSADAVQYRCFDIVGVAGDQNAVADLIVLDDNPTGSDNLTGKAVCPKSSVSLSCSVAFHSGDTSVKPSFGWLPNTVTGVDNTANSTHASSTAMLAVPTEPNATDATCTVEYPSGTSTSYSWSSESYSGTYYPQEVTISPNRSEYTEGYIVSCSAEICDGQVSYTWITSMNDSEFVGQEFTLVRGSYNLKCTVSLTPATASTKTYSSSTTIYVVVTPNTTTDESSSTTSGISVSTPSTPGTTDARTTTKAPPDDQKSTDGACPWWCILAIVLSIVAAIIAIIIIACCCCHIDSCWCHTWCNQHCIFWKGKERKKKKVPTATLR